jgi:HK97 gp10 family phage protein
MPLKRNRIPATREAIRRAAAEGVARAGGYIVDLARQLCPVDTGALRASIRLEPEQPELQMVVKAGGPTAPYAGYVERGTSRSAAQPFLTPAVRAVSVRKEVAKAIKGVLK